MRRQSPSGHSFCRLADTKLTTRGDPAHDHVVAGIVAWLTGLPRRPVVCAEEKARPDTGRVRALCAQGARKAGSNGLPAMSLRVKPLLRKRRIGDLNPGGP